MAKYILVDTANLFFRCLHAMQGDAYSRSGLALHVIFRSIRKLCRDHKSDHVVFCLEGKSWRYQVYPKYKMHRKVMTQMKTKREQEDDIVFKETFDELVAYLKEKTNTTVLQSMTAEGDDLIARWVQVHPDDQHVIVSGDTDFVQLLADNVTIYDGVRGVHIKMDTVLNEDGNPIEFSLKSDGKIKLGKELDLVNGDFEVEPDWWRRALFMKCIRGDSSDGIFSAYPKVRETKLKAAWADRKEMGFNWNNLMLQTWDDDGQSVRVLDKYTFNKSLIDLTLQPQEVIDAIDAAIIEHVQKKPVTGVGIHFMRFCEKNGLVNLGREAPDHAVYLNAPYSK